MKRTVLLVALLFALCGCVTDLKVVVPERPSFGAIDVYAVPGGICIEAAQWDILQGNITKLYQYSEVMRGELERLRGELEKK